MAEGVSQIAQLGAIDAGVLYFKAAMRDYGRAGGSAPTGAELAADPNDTHPE